MKTINIITLAFIFSAGITTSVEAQRREIGGGQRDNRQPNFSQPRVERAPTRTFNNPARLERVNSINSTPSRIENRNVSRENVVRHSNNSVRNINPSRTERIATVNNNTTSRIAQQNVINNRTNVARSSTERLQPVTVQSQSNNSTSRVSPSTSVNVDQQRRYDRNPARGNNNYANNTNNSKQDI